MLFAFSVLYYATYLSNIKNPQKPVNEKWPHANWMLSLLRDASIRFFLLVSMCVRSFGKISLVRKCIASFGIFLCMHLGSLQFISDKVFYIKNISLLDTVQVLGAIYAHFQMILYIKSYLQSC